MSITLTPTWQKATDGRWTLQLVPLLELEAWEEGEFSSAAVVISGEKRNELFKRDRQASLAVAQRWVTRQTCLFLLSTLSDLMPQLDAADHQAICEGLHRLPTKGREPAQLVEAEDPDHDLLLLSRYQVVKVALGMRRDIRTHRDAKGHNLCWYQPELWRHLPDAKKVDPQVPPHAEFLTKCAEYRDSFDRTGMDEKLR